MSTFVDTVFLRDPAVTEQVYKRIADVVGATYPPPGKPPLTAAEVKRRVRFAVAHVQECLNDLHWPVQRALDELPWRLHCFLESIPWEPDKRASWAGCPDTAPISPLAVPVVT